MRSSSTDKYDSNYFLKSPSLTITIIYVFISVLGFLYTLVHNSGYGTNLFNYYELTDFILIGIINYKVLLVAVSVILICNILFSTIYRYLNQKYRKPSYGQSLDDESRRWILKETLKSSFLSLLVRLPIIILLVLSILKYPSKASGLFILYMLLGVLYNLILIAIRALTGREILLDNSGVKIFIYIVILIGLFTGIALGYYDKKNPVKNDTAIITIENKVLKGDIIGTLKNHVFLFDSSIHVLNRAKIETIEYLGSKHVIGEKSQNETNSDNDSTLKKIPLQ